MARGVRRVRGPRGRVRTGQAAEVDLDGLLDGDEHVVVDGGLRVEHVDGERAARDAEHGRGLGARVLPEGGELGRVHRGRGDQQAQVRAARGHLAQDAEQHVRVERALVRLVHHHAAVLLEVRVLQRLAQQNPVRHVLDLRVLHNTTQYTPHTIPYLYST